MNFIAKLFSSISSSLSKIRKKQPAEQPEGEKPQDVKSESTPKRSEDSKIMKNKKVVVVVLLAVILICVAIVSHSIWKYLYGPELLDYYVNEPGITQLKDNAKPDPLGIQFDGSAAKLEHVGKVVESGIRLSPPIKGRWEWEGDDYLVFYPDEDWAVGAQYTITLSEALFPDNIHLHDYKYSFTTEEFSASIVDSEFYQDPTDPKIKKVVATVKFTHPVDKVDFEKRITLRMKGQKKGILGIGGETYPYSVSYDKFLGEAYIHSNPIKIPEDDSYLTIEIEKGVRSIRGGRATDETLKQSVSIPGMYNFFRIDDVESVIVRNERFEPERVIIVESTAAVFEKEIQDNISAFILPKDKPASQGQKEIEDYYWGDVKEIGPEILNLSTPLDLVALPVDKEYTSTHSFKYEAEAGRYIYIKLNKGIKSFGDYVLAKEYDTVVTVPAFPRELQIMHDGAILSISGEKKLSILSRDVEAIRFEIARVLPGQINHLVTQSSGNFKSPYFRNYNFNQDNITELFTETRTLASAGEGVAQYSAFDFSKYLHPVGSSGSKRGLFFFKVEGWDPESERTTGIEDKRFILITDLGILVKDNADDSHNVFIQSLLTGKPVSGVKISVMGKNGISILRRTTDTDGNVTFPSMKDFEREKEPVVYIAKKGEDISFIPYDKRDRNINYSRFDTGGVHTEISGDQLDAYLFSDRGIYRPGDTFHIGMIVKHSDWKRNLAGIPLEAVVLDARGLVVQKRKIRLSSSGFEEIQYTTEETSPTGEYQINVYIIKDERRGGLLGSTTVRVEEFLPDRLSITTRLSKELIEGWVSPDDLKGNVTLMNLFGTPATGRRVAAEITLSPSHVAFRSFKEYRFFDPMRAEKRYSERLEDQKTNENGEAEFQLDLGRFERATYRLRFIAEGYEAEGGRGVTSESSVIVSPLKYLIGYKPDGDLGYISKNSDRKVEIIAIDSAMNKIEVADIKSRIVEVRYVSVLTKQPNGTYKYESVKKEIDLSENNLKIPDKGLAYRLPTDLPGDFALIIQDSNGTELSRVEYSVIGSANLTRSLEKNAELQVKLNKSDFAPGENIELYIKAPYVGAGLITIERDRIYEYKWFRTTTTNSVQKIKVPHDLEGNGYVNVSFVRAPSSEEIFMSPLSYGVVPFSVSRDKRTVRIDLESKDLARPGEPFVIKYKGNKKGKIVVFAIDEGILQVANYKTPDPLSYFFKKRALQVDTSQILDLLLPEFRLLQKLSAPGGGDEYGEEAIGKNLNPFKRKRVKPVAYWSGILDIDKQERELTYKVPDYFNGTLRVMAVAVSPDAIGVVEKKSFIRGHFVLSPNVPTFVSPDDEFEISLGIANNVEGSGEDPDINIEVRTSEHVSVQGEASKVMNISEGHESSTTFKVKANNILGSGNFTFTASLGGKKSKYSIDLSIRPPVPYVTTINSGYFKSDTIDLPTERKLHPDYRKLKIGVSPLPLGIAHGLVSYLEEFPYGCTEQLVSKAFPAIVLRSRPEFGYNPVTIESSLSRTIRVLRARQNAEGAFGFWAANSHYSEFQTVYAMHFLTEAREKGYSVPSDLMDHGLTFLEFMASNESDTLADARVRAYAIYILTRNGYVITNSLNTLHDELDDKFEDKWEKDLAGIYMAATYQLLKLERKANGLISKSRLGDRQMADYRNFYDGLTRDAQFLYILAKHFPERLKNLKGDDVLKIVDPLVNRQFNTTSSAYTILALDAYATSVGTPMIRNIAVSEVQKDKKTVPIVLPQKLFPNVDFSDKAEAIRVSNDTKNVLFYHITQAGFDLKPPEKVLKDGLEVQREYRDTDGNVISDIALGTEIEVHIKARSLGKGDLHNVALVDLLPGGFEVVLDTVQRENYGTRWVSPIASDKSTLETEYVDIREDRVVIFGTIQPKVTEFIYRIKATNKGTFIVPPIFGESMYDRSIQSLSLGGKFTIMGN
jgi:uncharacterized protein YfaS (alpha-2-macroglobulin family)